MRRALLMTTVALAAGCGGLFKSSEPAATVYALNAPAGAPFAAPLPAVLIVPKPSAAAGLDTEHVPVALPDHRVDSLAHVRFNAALPELVQTLLIESLRARHGFHAVLGERHEFAGQFLLQSEIREFRAEYATADQAPLVTVRIEGDLGRTRAAELIATVTGHASAQATSNHQRAIIAAFDQALGAALIELGDAVYAACGAPAPSAAH